MNINCSKFNNYSSNCKISKNKTFLNNLDY